jgi:hypothetical protein
MSATTLELRGYLVGHIWMPNVECWKDLSYNITREDSQQGTLRDHVLRATNDGDFRSCVIAGGELVATRREQREGRTVTIERRWPLDCFKSIRDMLHDDPDWMPPYDED